MVKGTILCLVQVRLLENNCMLIVYKSSQVIEVCAVYVLLGWNFAIKCQMLSKFYVIHTMACTLKYAFYIIL